LDFIREGKADSLARLRAESSFSAWRWPRLRRTPAWEAAWEQALPAAALPLEQGLPEAPPELRPERAATAVGTPKQLIDRMDKPSS